MSSIRYQEAARGKTWDLRCNDRSVVRALTVTGHEFRVRFASHVATAPSFRPVRISICSGFHAIRCRFRALQQELFCQISPLCFPATMYKFAVEQVLSSPLSLFSSTSPSLLLSYLPSSLYCSKEHEPEHVPRQHNSNFLISLLRPHILYPIYLSYHLASISWTQLSLSLLVRSFDGCESAMPTMRRLAMVR